MYRKFSYWFGIPFLAIACTFIATAILAPELIGGDAFMPILLSLAAVGFLGSAVNAVWTIKDGESPLSALYPLAAVFVMIGTSFGPEVGKVAGAMLNYAMASRIEAEGVRFGAAEDGRFRRTAYIDGKAVDFVVDTAAADIVLTPDDARRIGIDTSSLIFDQYIVTEDGTEAAAGIRLRRFDMGFFVLEDLPAKVSATGRPGNVLGKAFFDRFSDWRVENGTLMVLP